MVKGLIMTFIIAMVPVLELRGAIPIGTAAGVEPHVATLVAVIGNLVPVPFIILFIRRIFAWMRTKNNFFNRIVTAMEEKASKNMEKVFRYENIGLFLLVAVPLPGTGAWTGALVAAFLDMRLKRCALPITLGVIVAGIIVYIITYGVTVVV